MTIPISPIPAFLAACILVGLLHAAAVDAQALPEGSMVRIHRADPPPLTGLVEGLSTDTVWLRIAGVGEPIALTTIRRLELRQRATRAQSGWKWAKRGLLAGAVLGGVTCLSDREECVTGLGPDDGLTEGLLASSMFLGGGVAFLGFVVGAVLPGHRWVDVPVPGGSFD